MAPSTLRILQHNVLSWTSVRKNELYNIYKDIDPDILLINSHGKKDSERIKIFQYQVYQKNYTEELHDGVAIAIKNGIRHTIIDDLDENYLGIKVETTLGMILVATGYQPPRRPMIPNQNLLRIFRHQIPVIFAGDVNARHRNYGHGNNNQAGDQIWELTSRGNVIHQGPNFKTFITPRACGTPDVVLTNNRIIHNMHITPGQLTTSDHLPIIITLSASPIQIPITPRLDLKHANWDAFKTELNSFDISDLQNQPTREIENKLGRWFDAITRAMNNHIPTIKHRTLPHPSIPTEIKDIQRTFRMAQRQSQINGWTPVLRNLVKTLQNNLQEKFKTLHNKTWEELIAKTQRNYRNPEMFWKDIRRMMGNDSEEIKYILGDNGEKLTKPSEQAEQFKRFWLNVFQISDIENQDFCPDNEIRINNYLREHADDFAPFTHIDINRLDRNNYITRPITRIDLTTTIKKFKNKKAPGKSQIDKTILQNLPDNMISELINILNAALSAGIFPKQFKTAIIKMILKSGKHYVHTANYRPISLLETAGKAFERIINDRLRLFLQVNNLNNPRQHAYQKNKGTSTAIALTYEQIAHSQQDREQCNVVFRDLTKAFDKVWHNGLKYKILQLNLPRCLTSLLCNFLDDRTAAIRVKNYTTNPFPLLSGVPQGSVLSPSLFTIFTADTGELTHSNYVSYADDVTQIINYHGKSKEFMRRKTERAINELNNYERRWKIRTNKNKFQILHVSKHRPLPINVDGNNIDYTPTAKLLGLTIKKTGISSHLKQKKILANLTLQKLKRFNKLNAKTKLHLYKALVLPILEYPAIPLNTLKKSNWSDIQTIQNRALRWVDNLIPPYNKNSEDLHRHYKILPLNIRNFYRSQTLWNNISSIFPEEVEAMNEMHHDNTHKWWPLSYIDVNTPPPQPNYG